MKLESDGIDVVEINAIELGNHYLVFLDSGKQKLIANTFFVKESNFSIFFEALKKRWLIDYAGT